MGEMTIESMGNISPSNVKQISTSSTPDRGTILTVYFEDRSKAVIEAKIGKPMIMTITFDQEVR